ncbi:TIGR00730 family Rossman fold protein [Salaquimonas pukyongi]|uniref:LOG family protein n=1 Tax=Salaquimonas pukyongi TaxID=2712698 RepID=UPI00096BABC5|nr:TIGR00730 family Rossman fold protein [Salaquimonas pukyongi]
MAEISSICVYCGSQPGNHPAFREAARILGRTMAERDICLVYGGGGMGIMGEISRSVIEHGGKVTGVIPEFLISKERGTMGCDDDDGELGEVVVTRDMHERKTRMFELSQAFVALPGGIGTLEEVVEMLTWAQLGRHDYPVVFANIEGFWDPLIDLLSHMAEAGFIHTSQRLKPMVVRDPANIVEEILNA